MTEPRFTTEQAMEALRKAVELKGANYMYPDSEKNTRTSEGTCMYSHKGQPSCIVGHVINILDPKVFAGLETQEMLYGPQGAEDLTLQGYLPADFWSKDTGRVMAIAQGMQDTRHSWGDALAEAEDKV